MVLYAMPSITAKIVRAPRTATTMATMNELVKGTVGDTRADSDAGLKFWSKGGGVGSEIRTITLLIDEFYFTHCSS